MRTTRKATSIVIATALALSAAACSGGDAPPGTLATAKPSTASVKPTSLPVKTLNPTADNPLGADWSKQVPFTGPAADAFGAANVMTAYRHALTFSLQEGSSDLMTKGYDARPVEFSFLDRYLTTEMQQVWAKDVKAALAKDVGAGQRVSSLTGWNAGAREFKFRVGQQLLFVGTDFSPASTSVETVGEDDYLVLRFTVSQNLRMMDGSKAVLVPLERDITYRLAPNGLKDMPWLIDNWTIQASGGVPTPDPMGATS